jgi:hypothetical protein
LVTKEELLDLAWPGLVVEENNLQVQVSTLRKILGTDAIATIAGKGYRFTPQIEAGSLSHPIQALERPPVAELAAKPSIAVLPFVNTSDEAANEYFADGLAEELLNVLSKVRGLRVASRTSAFSFKGAKVDIPTIGAEAQRGDDPRRQRAQGRQPGADQRAAHSCRHRLAPVVIDL